jgi:hypothetical protein
MGAGRFSAVLSLLAEHNSTWIPDILLPKQSGSDKITVTTYTNTTDLKAEQFTCDVQNTRAWYSHDF